jgi:DnaJ-class molecular chaperone
MIVRIEFDEPCDDCWGTGRAEDGVTKCRECMGTGHTLTELGKKLADYLLTHYGLKPEAA